MKVELETVLIAEPMTTGTLGSELWIFTADNTLELPGKVKLVVGELVPRKRDGTTRREI
jgi:hypothetical protein